MNRKFAAPGLFLMLVVTFLVSGCGKKEVRSGGTTTGSDTTGVRDSASLLSGGIQDTLFTYEERQGKYAYDKYCAVCHGAEGKGDGFNAFNLDPKPRDFSDAKYANSINDERLVLTISGGGRAVNRSPLMPAWGGTLAKPEIHDIVSYLRTFSRSK